MVIRSGLHMVSPNRVHRWWSRPGFHTADLSWPSAGRPWPGFHLAGPSHGPSHGRPHAGHQTADPRSMGSGRAFTVHSLDSGRVFIRQAIISRRALTGPSYVRSQSGYYKAGPVRLLYVGSQPDFHIVGLSPAFICRAFIKRWALSRWVPAGPSPVGLATDTACPALLSSCGLRFGFYTAGPVRAFKRRTVKPSYGGTKAGFHTAGLSPALNGGLLPVLNWLTPVRPSCLL